jgi:hypothetical protein
MRLEHPRSRAAWGLAGGVVLGLLAIGTTRRTARAALVTAAALAAVMAAQRLAYRLDAGPEALVERDLLGATALPWRDVERVQIEPNRLVVRGRGERRIEVATAQLHPEVRATLERLISRRVAEGKSGAR